MKILALESSATVASVALCEDETLLAQAFLHTGLTHSQTLLPMARDLLKACGLTPAQVDLIAVAAGPGSFTGLRIGVATAKGLAWAAEKPCAGCSTLASMAWNLAGFSGQVCVAMDARRRPELRQAGLPGVHQRHPVEHVDQPVRTHGKAVSAGQCPTTLITYLGREPIPRKGESS